jgi:hypothetical protein
VKRRNVARKVGGTCHQTVAPGAHATPRPDARTRSMKIKSSAARKSGKPPTARHTSRRIRDDGTTGPRIRPPGRSTFGVM